MPNINSIDSTLIVRLYRRNSYLAMRRRKFSLLEGTFNKFRKISFSCCTTEIISVKMKITVQATVNAWNLCCFEITILIIILDCSIGDTMWAHLLLRKITFPGWLTWWARGSLVLKQYFAVNVLNSDSWNGLKRNLCGTGEISGYTACEHQTLG